jgi:hypothetical protein
MQQPLARAASPHGSAEPSALLHEKAPFWSAATGTKGDRCDFFFVSASARRTLTLRDGANSAHLACAPALSSLIEQGGAQSREEWSTDPAQAAE